MQKFVEFVSPDHQPVWVDMRRVAVIRPMPTGIGSDLYLDLSWVQGLISVQVLEAPQNVAKLVLEDEFGPN